MNGCHGANARVHHCDHGVTSFSPQYESPYGIHCRDVHQRASEARENDHDHRANDHGRHVNDHDLEKRKSNS